MTTASPIFDLNDLQNSEESPKNEEAVAITRPTKKTPTVASTEVSNMPARPQILKVKPEIAISHQADSFYVSALNFLEVRPFLKVHRLAVHGDEGYQRSVDKTHAKEYASATEADIIAGHQLEPRSVTLSLEGGSWDEKTRTLTIKGNDVLWAIDGQHWFEKMEILYNKMTTAQPGPEKEALERYINDTRFVCIIGNGWSQGIQSKIFFEMNGKAKKVAGSVSLMAQANSGFGFKKKAEGVAFQVALRLARESTSPFQNRVIFTQQGGGGNISIQNLFTAIKNYYQPVDAGETYNQVIQLWQPLVDAFRVGPDPDKRLFNTSVFNGVFLVRDLLMPEGAAQILKERLGETGLATFKAASGAGKGANDVAALIREIMHGAPTSQPEVEEVETSTTLELGELNLSL